MKELYAYSSLLNVLTCLVIIVAVLVKNPRSVLVRLFCVFTGIMGSWAFLYFRWVTSPTVEAAEFFVRSLMIFTAFMGPSFLHFVSELSERRLSWRLHLANYLVGIALASTVYTPHFAAYGSKPFLAFRAWPTAGPMLYVQLIHFLVGFGTGLLMMYSVIRSGEGLLRTRIIAVFWGTLVAVVTGATNFLPWFKIYVPPIFPPFLSLFVCFYAYAIVKHQLMDIEVIVKRTLQFAGLAGSVVAVVSLVAFVSQDVLARFVQVPKWLSNVFAAAIIAVLYEPLRNWLTNATDKYLFQKRYDYKELLKKFTDEVMVVLDLKQLVQMTVNTLTETVKLEACSLLLLNKDTRKYELMAAKGVNGRPITVEEREPFITFLRETNEPIGQDGQLGKVRFPESVTERLKQLNARLCLPLHVHDDLIGVLCLGKKKSDEEFAKDDLDILLPLARTLAIAVSNAQLVTELQVTQAQAAQKEKLAVIGTLSAGINHEICNPLGIVKAQCEAFLLDSEDGILIGKSQQDVLERTSNIMRVALKQIDRATAITQKLSNFAKPIRETVTQPVSVEQEVDEVLLLVGHDLQLEKITVQKEIQPDLPPIIVDRRQFQEVLFNLIRNAGQAIAPPGTIWVRAHAEGEKQVRIEIADTGGGIPADKLEKIFDPFYTTKEPGKGTGLGLFIVRQIVERNKGRILVESVVGKGTTFFLDFPAAKPAAVAV